ncbi:MAG: hypothetical protein GY754_32140 [bacterium]|nr:hypothetical protein [bacterium]
MDKKNIIGIATAIVLVFSVVFCDKTIELDHGSYSTTIKAEDFAAYKGKTINLYGFYNSADNTKRYEYYSPDKNAKYQTSSLIPDYIWYSYEKALTQIGVIVNKEYDTGKTPYLTLEMKSLTDREFKYTITLSEGGDIPLYQNDFTIKTQIESYDSSKAKKDEAYYAKFQKASYKMIDDSLSAFLSDPAFQLAFLKETVKIEKPEEVVISTVKRGKLIGIVKEINYGTGQIILGSKRIGKLVKMGDRVYVIVDDNKIYMKVSFPMQSIAKCRIAPEHRKFLNKIKKRVAAYK